MTPPQQPTPIKKVTEELSSKARDFLLSFPNTVFTYIPDNDNKPVHTSQALELTKQKDGYGIFFSVNGFFGNRRVNENLQNINAFFLDVDLPKGMEKTPENIHQYKNDMVMQLMSGEYLEPTYINETKNGLHVYWVLQAPIYLANLNPDQIEYLKKEYLQIEECILKLFEGDPQAKDIPRVLRVPETLHQKDPNNRFMIKQLVSQPSVTYKYSEIKASFFKATEPEGWATVSSGENAIDEEVKKTIEKEYPRLERPSYKGLIEQTAVVPEGMRNKALLVVAHACKEAGMKLDEVYAKFQTFYGLKTPEIRKTIRSAYDHNYDFGYKNEVMATVASEEEKEKLSTVTKKILSENAKEKKDASDAIQKKMFLTYEHDISKRYPTLKYKVHGDFYDYSNGVYKSLHLDDIRSMFLREMEKDGMMNYRKLSAVADKIACFKSLPEKMFTHADENKNQDILNVQNGLLDIEKQQLYPHTPDYLSTVQIPIQYDPQAKCPQWLRFVYEIMDEDPEQTKLLQQIAGYILTADVRFAKAFILYGYGANGKSLFTRMIGKLIGKEHVSNVNLTTLTKQFGLTGVIGKKLNVVDEISGNYFESNIIKALISGERMSCDIKYRPEPIEFDPVVKLLFSVNELPKINDTTPGLYRRFLIVPFTRTFVKNPDLELEEKLSSEMPGILNWAIQGLVSLRQDGKFNETEKNHEALRVFQEENSPVLEFFKTTFEFAPIHLRQNYVTKVSDIYSGYVEYCRSGGYKSKSLVNFSKELSHMNIEGKKIEKAIISGKTVIYGIRPQRTISGDDIVYNDNVMQYE